MSTLTNVQTLDSIRRSSETVACSDNSGILLQLLCFQKMDVVGPNNMGKFEEQLFKSLSISMTLPDTIKEVKWSLCS